MLFGLDGIPLTLPKTGVGHYTAELARALAAAAPADTFELVYPSSEAPPEGALDPLPARPPNLRTRRVEVGVVGRHWWALGLPRFARREGAYDLFHGTNFDVPLWPGRPTVLTVHDLSTLLHPETHTPRSVRRARRRLPLMTRVATVIITPTEAVRREVCERLSVPAA
ncbi:MAG TPA: glycosyltransferase, partial [Pyrinomonadaceae bacterium]